MKVAFVLLFLGVALAIRPDSGFGDVFKGNTTKIASKAASMAQVMHLKTAFWDACAVFGDCPMSIKNIAGTVKCENGKAGIYACKNMDMHSFVSLSSLGSSGNGNDIWGWEDQLKQRKIAISCVYNGVSFIDMTFPKLPNVIGFLPTTTFSSSWRDVKVIGDYAYIVSEAYDHGMQSFDLTQLRAYYDTPTNQIHTFGKQSYNRFTGFGSSHNIVSNEQAEQLYIVGSKECKGGLYIMDVSENPASPKKVGCFEDDDYTHDAQCVTYYGPDNRYTGKHICFAFNEDTLTIVDVTYPDSAKQISREYYPDVHYSHQGWLLKGGKYLVMNDELDEMYSNTLGGHTRTMFWDVSDLEKPTYLEDKTFLSKETVIDHNLYTLETHRLIYLSNYCGGLRVYGYDDSDDDLEIEEVAYFDVAPDCDMPEFKGSWSSYIYFDYGEQNVIAVNSIDRGLFIVELDQAIYEKYAI